VTPAPLEATPFLVSVGLRPGRSGTCRDLPTCEDFHPRAAPRVTDPVHQTHTRKTDVDHETTDDE
jgi:hypothetical protein